ncbi:BTB/POZ domain-containing protein At5g47800-like isoform X1 [Syzygium oleosum]|uniref:BTB/POZ domain-containing protein At5g47800-like isoform X1 n=1 Tax=Syzygium oleosum TaxID=219896 RepID=UPI0024B8CFB6|nr:BTB/POZ domain-containing protein At5g47800-like isoform X1 [Syzygium oleosum]XP_056159906.1 BTB/POZ domain-containing protein At5g47800-like isoform X1 [Syzygium oleosum]XP_056159907.1 BTB/POZ domain-containing protein At5g47800-like isoform X1 [Syzygium oleosum]XP_056159908.1 BTB/POZ domain-containing protein At5g47800-like isoform X1 [Syzygium oleosum]XP_056159909.1 BTB/POZ domain-containing protein At5g47800-like isoform X1 [Syzygium oleosum]
MKFMKLGTRPDTFYTEEATRTVTSDTPTDLILRINNINYLLHKLQFALLPKCGLLQQLCPTDDGEITIDLHDIPGGEEAFELCAKYCYGITINFSAYNFLPAFCAAKFLRMTEAVEKGNFVLKLEAFFHSCILEGWKDSIITLQTTIKLPEWSESLGIARRCMDSIVEKILTPPPKVTWSYTYTRPGYDKKHRQSVPRDWWTEDISDLDIDLFRYIIVAVRSTNMLPSQLIGEALHVYASRWLPDTTRTRTRTIGSAASQPEEITVKNRRILEAIVSMIPAERGSLSINFLLRLLSLANYLGSSPLTKTELVRRSSQQLEEATVSDLLFPSYSTSDQHLYDVELVRSVLESFWVLWRRQAPGPSEKGESMRSVRKVGKLIDSYLQVISKDVNMPASKVVSLAECLPDVARPLHDDLYKAINIYLKQEHPDLSKADKKFLCRILDCQKLSPEVRAHAVKNERLPLRTVVQALFFDQEKTARGATTPHNSLTSYDTTTRGKETLAAREDQGKQKLSPEVRFPRADGPTIFVAETSTTDHPRIMQPDIKLPRELERKLVMRETEEGVESSEKAKDVATEERSQRSMSDPHKIGKRTGKTDRGHNKGRER